ncbi:MAG: CHASE3 domain-containing protein [Gemmataceae bacterium]
MIPLLAQLAFLGVLALTRNYHQQTQEKATHTHKVISQAESCYRQVIEAQLQMRGYVLTLNPLYVRSYEKVRDSIPGEFDELTKLVADNPEQRQRAIQIKGMAWEFIDWMNQNLRLASRGERDHVIDRIPTTGAALSRGLRDLMDEFLNTERRLDEMRNHNLAWAIRVQTAVLFGGFAMALATSFALLMAFSQSVSRRVGTLINNTRRFAEGRELAPRLNGKDELQQIDAVFHDMADSLRQKEQENELFVYSVSHDLRSPLVNLQGFSQELGMAVNDLRTLVNTDRVPDAIKVRTNQLIDRDMNEAIHYIQSSVMRLSGIIDALMRLSRIGRVEFRMQEVDVGAVVGHVVAALHNSLMARGAVVGVDTLQPCWGDTRAIDQIFANLIGNAVTYLDPARPGRIEIGMVNDEAWPDYHTYYVRDNGLGIPEKLQAKVFIAFQRLHPGTAPGEGVGLALVRRVVERLGGRVWLTSREGEGSTFYVALPASAEARTSPTAPARTHGSAATVQVPGLADTSAEWPSLPST